MLQKLAAEIEKTLAERDKLKAETAKTGASIPGVQAQTAKTGAEARTENVNATMSEISATQALRLSGMLSPTPPPAAGVQPGAFGSPPSEANGPPPF